MTCGDGVGRAWRYGERTTPHLSPRHSRVVELVGRFRLMTTGQDRGGGLRRVDLLSAITSRKSAKVKRIRKMPARAVPRHPRPSSPAPDVKSDGQRTTAVRRRGRGAGGGSTGTAKAWQPTGTGLVGHGRPARGQRPARPVCGLPAVGAEGLRPGARDSGPGRSAELADRLAGFANLSPCRTAS